MRTHIAWQSNKQRANFQMKPFSAKIYKIGINPYVNLPASVLHELFRRSGKNKGPIPVRGRLNGKEFTQTLVKYSGKWRLYLNTPMRKVAGVNVGDIAKVSIEFDPAPRVTRLPLKLMQALAKNKKAKIAFERLTPSRRKEIMRYIGHLKTDESVVRNVGKVIQHLSGNVRFAGRD